MSATRQKTTNDMAKSNPLTWAFTWMLQMARPLYEGEIARLAYELRPRILAGAFSGHGSVNEGGDTKYMRLIWELEKHHPWCRSEAASHLVLACSTWPTQDAKLLKEGELYGDAPVASDCMARDILNLAAKEGWVKRIRRHNERNPYALVKPRSAA